MPFPCEVKTICGIFNFLYIYPPFPTLIIRQKLRDGKNSKRDEGWLGKYFGKFQLSENLRREMQNLL